MRGWLLCLANLICPGFVGASVLFQLTGAGHPGFLPLQRYLVFVRKDSSLNGIIYEYKFHTVSIVKHLLLLTSLQSFDFQLACRIIHTLSRGVALCLPLHRWQLYPGQASFNKLLRTLLFL